MAKLLGLARLERKLRRLPDVATAKIKEVMEQSANEIVRMMKSLVPTGAPGSSEGRQGSKPATNYGALRDSIGWTWGSAPKGALTLGRVKGPQLGKGLTITIYAGDAKAFYARWVEFGTAPHIAGGKFKGAIHPGTAARPYFFPSYRANRKPAKAAIRKAVRAAAKQVAAGG